MIHRGPCVVIDLDGTLTQTKRPEQDYADLVPRRDILDRLQEYHAAGYHIIIQTARNMRTHEGNLGQINAKTVPVVLDWLARHEVPYDELHVGKPWCGDGGFYVDDKAVRPSEFRAMSPAEIAALLADEAAL